MLRDHTHPAHPTHLCALFGSFSFCVCVYTHTHELLNPRTIGNRCARCARCAGCVGSERRLP